MAPMLCKPMRACHFPGPAAGPPVASATAAITSSRRGRPLARPVIWPCGPSTNSGGGPPDVEQPDQVQPVGHVDLHMGDAGVARGHVGEQLPGRAAGRAERGGELEQGGLRPERLAKLGHGQRPPPPAGAAGREPPIAAAQRERPRGREHQDGSRHDRSGKHAGLQHQRLRGHSRAWRRRRGLGQSAGAAAHHLAVDGHLEAAHVRARRARSRPGTRSRPATTSSCRPPRSRRSRPSPGAGRRCRAAGR